MSDEKIWNYIKQQGYDAVESRYGQSYILQKGTTQIMYDEQHIGEHVRLVVSVLRGPRPEDDFLNTLIRLHEEKAMQQGKPFDFVTGNVYYRHPLYYKFSFYHTKKPDIMQTPALFELFALLYSRLLKKTHDPLFEWDIDERSNHFFLSFVKEGVKKTVRFSLQNQQLCFQDSRYPESTVVGLFDNPEECVNAVINHIHKHHRKYRLQNVYTMPLFYTKRALHDLKLNENQFEALVHDFQSRYTAEELELHFKHVYHLLRIDNKHDSDVFLVQLLDRWVFKTRDEIAFFDLDAFDNAFFTYQQYLMNYAFDMENQALVSYFEKDEAK